MQGLVLLLLIFLVVMVALVIAAIVHKSVSGTFEFPAPPELMSDEEKAFIENPELVTKLYYFINAEYTSMFVYYIPGIDAPDPITLLNKNINFIRASKTHMKKHVTNIEYEIKMLELEANMGKIDKKVSANSIGILNKFIEYANHEIDIAYNNAFRDINYAKNIKKGIFLIPLRVESPDGTTHAITIIIDYDNKRFIKINPHGYMEEFSHKEITTWFLYYLKDQIPHSKEFDVIDLAELTSKYTCPVFQGSFKELAGLCVLWSLYISFLFIKNDQTKFDSMVNAHARNAKWTQRRLQNFAFKIFKDFEDLIVDIPIDEIDQTIIGEPIAKPKGY